MTCVPAFAPSTRLGSTSDGIVASRYGASLEPAVLRRVERPLEVIDPRGDDDPAAEAPLGLRPVAGRGEPGQLAEGEGDRRDRPRRPDVRGPPAEPGPDDHGIEQRRQDALGVRAGDDDPRRDLLARREPHAGHPPVGVVISATSAPVRISPPRSRTAAASAAERPPGPPRA